MRRGNRSRNLIAASFLICLLVGSDVAEGQSPDQSVVGEEAAAANLPGRQWFEHQWEWKEPPPRSMIIRSRTAGGKLIRRGVADFSTGDPPGDGLGPLHNATSCAECHAAGGGSGVQHNVTLITVDPRSEVLKETETGGSEVGNVFPGLLGPAGILVFNTVVHDRSTRTGYEPIREGLAGHVPGGIDDAWFVPEKRSVAAIADQPIVAGRHNRVDFYLSQRNSTALYGAGQIDTVNLDRLRELARRQTERSGGKISGRVAGKFGWRGQVHSLHEFVVGACSGELGLNISGPVNGATIPVAFPGQQASDPADPTYVNFGIDMTPRQLSSLSGYVALLPRPVERPDSQHSWQEVRAGEEVFNSIQCQSCHVADVHPISGLFSDLLLHDMGPRLQDPEPAPIGELVGVSTIATPRFKTATPASATQLTSGAGYYGTARPSHPKPYALPRPEQPQFPRGQTPDWAVTSDRGTAITWDSLQREWRTPPLWGVADSAPYLHDGRAATLEDAILWHGGEADSSRHAFSELARSDKDLLLAFLASLRAPE